MFNLRPKQQKRKMNFKESRAKAKNKETLKEYYGNKNKWISLLKKFINKYKKIVGFINKQYYNNQ